MSIDKTPASEPEAGPGGLRFGRTEADGTTQLWYEIDVRGERQAVWDVVTSPEFVREFYYGLRIETEWEAGGPIRYVEPDGTACLLGVIERVEVGRFFTVSIRYVADPEAARDTPSVVHWELRDLGGGRTRVRVEHRGLLSRGRTLTILAGGWPTAMHGIKELVESGSAIRAQGTWPEARVSALIRAREGAEE